MKLHAPLRPPHKNNATGKLSLSQTIAKRLVIKALSSMKKGALEIHCPDNSVLTFGEENKADKAIIKLANNRFWLRSVLFGDIGFAESYIDADWDTNDLQSVLSWFIINNEDSPLLEDSRRKAFWSNILGIINKLAHDLKANTIAGSKTNIGQHYDLSNDLFAIFLDDSMTYSCAKFSQSNYSLEDAQLEKFDSLCNKLKLKPTDRVLEIGSGWGSFAIYAALKYGCHITATTISSKQYEFMQNKIAKLELSDKIEILLQDYRKLNGEYDKIVSVEMIEAVGEKYLDTFFAVLHKLLKKNGLLALQMITCPDNRYEIMSRKVDFIQKHIFPGGLLPSLGRINQAINRTTDFSIFEIEDLGLSYVKTLDIWFERFNARLNEVKELGFDNSFVRKWNYYLKYCSAGFATRNVSAVQVIFTRPNNLTLT